MIVADLKLVILLWLLGAVGIALLAVQIDRRLIRTPQLHLTRGSVSQVRQAFEAAPFGIVLLESQDRYLYANEYACRLLELNPSHEIFTSAPWLSALREDLATVRHSGTGQPYYRTLALSAEQNFFWWLCPLPSFTIAFLLDVNHQRKTEKAYHTFLGNFSHELRTPLTAILAHVEVLRSQPVAEITQRSSLDVIQQETQRISRLVISLLELNKLETTLSLNKRAINLLLVAEQAVAEVILIGEARRIAISLHTATPLPRVFVDADLLKQVFLNVLDNAVKYCRAGDRVDVVLEQCPQGVRAVIRDSGPGIAPEHIPNLTGRFYRLRTDIPGNGLGLALAEEILHHHQSKLEIESQHIGDESGTTFSFLLPSHQ